MITRPAEKERLLFIYEAGQLRHHFFIFLVGHHPNPTVLRHFTKRHRQMNKIEGLLDKSDYEGYYDFINFRIDNHWLDEKLDELYPGNMYDGLIPTLVFWLDTEAEKAVVWKRIIPNENEIEIEICPILMCPDDCDFSCTLIVAEIQNYGTFIQWKRIGIDETKDWEAEKVGTTVKWLDDFPELNFEKADYLKMVDSFKAEYELEKLRQN